ncbi:MAG: hypothetical protein J7L47_10585, partial [Candidatus Odinarchaeota archaeon]|nr:hypothetical protein [Candidatus Odinarchaeota archaeon]
MWRDFPLHRTAVLSITRIPFYWGSTTHGLMTHIKAIEINEENVINFAASLGISATSIDIIMEMLEDKIQTILEASTVKLLAYAKIMFLLFFGTARD